MNLADRANLTAGPAPILMADEAPVLSAFRGYAYDPCSFFCQVCADNPHLSYVAVYGPAGDVTTIVFARFFEREEPGGGDYFQASFHDSDEEYLCWSPERDPDRAAVAEGPLKLVAMVRKFLADATVRVELTGDAPDFIRLEGVDRESAEYFETGHLVIGRIGPATRETIERLVFEHNRELRPVTRARR